MSMRAQNPGATLTIGLVGGGEYTITAQGVLDLNDSRLTAEANLKLELVREQGRAERAEAKHRECLAALGQQQVARRIAEAASSRAPVPVPDTSSLHGNPDAAAWARAFIAMQEHLRWPRLDEETMLSWFANAMMAMHDFHQRGPRSADR